MQNKSAILKLLFIFLSLTVVSTYGLILKPPYFFTFYSYFELETNSLVWTGLKYK